MEELLLTRQNHLVIWHRPNDHWISTACYTDVKAYIGTLQKGETVTAEFSLRRKKEVRVMPRVKTLLGTKQLIMGIVWVILWYLGDRYGCMGSSVLAGGIAAAGAFIAYGLSDASHAK